MSPARRMAWFGAIAVAAGVYARACAAPPDGVSDGGGTSSYGGGPAASGAPSGMGGTSVPTAIGGATAAGAAPTTPVGCGNTQVDPGEECDDGNVASGDGCSSHCKSACETCERDVCPVQTPFNGHPWYAYAYQMDGVADAGPKAGTARSELVRSALECIYASQCTLVYNNEAPIVSQISLRECFCKNAPAGTPPASYPAVCKDPTQLQAGPCLAQMLAASETDTVEAMLSKLTNLSTPLGRVFDLLQHCDARVCGGECLPKETGLEPKTGSGGAGGAP